MERIHTEYWMKPIPDRRFDWLAFYEGDEPNDGGSMSHGEGRTEAEAVIDLIENHPRGIWCVDKQRRCDECMHSSQTDENCLGYACNIHGTPCGWGRLPVMAESSCPDHAFPGEQWMGRTLPQPAPPQDDVRF